MSTTSVAVVYAAMLEFAFHPPEYWKSVPAGCLVPPVGTVTPAGLIFAPVAFIFMLVLKVFSKIVGVYPVNKVYKAPKKEAMYTTLLMSTGLTFGTISSLFGLSRGIIDQGQYSALVAAVIASAVIPTVIANAFYLPRHLLPAAGPEPKPTTDAQAAALPSVSGKVE